MSCSRVLILGEREPAVVYGLARALVMVLMARARRDSVVLAPMHVGCGALRLALPLGARMAHRPVLQRLARGWPAGGPDVVSAYSVQAVAVLDARPSVPELGFCGGPDPAGVISDLLDAVPSGLDQSYSTRVSTRGVAFALPPVIVIPTPTIITATPAHVAVFSAFASSSSASLTSCWSCPSVLRGA